MALKALMLRKKIDDKKKALEDLRAKDESFQTREAELEESIAEAGTDEEKTAVEAEIDAYNEEKTAHEDAKSGLEREIGDLEAQLKEEEERQKATPANRGRKEPEMQVRDVTEKFFNMNAQERDVFFAREDVQTFLGQVRNLRDSGIGNGQVLIPNVMLPYLRQVVEESSKMLKHVNLVPVPGEGSMVIDGGFPEGVWTEMCATLNQLQISYNNVTVGGYKVGGYVKVCNALLEDSDIALAQDIISKLGRAIGYALDKAILYGTGTKMPAGILPRLAQTAAPASYPATARTWVDLHTSNIVKITVANSTGSKLFQEIVTIFGNASNKFSKGGKFWAMNDKTKTKLIAEALSFNAAGAIVSGVNDVMPVIGGTIETLDFIPDNVIIAGYDGLYLVAERAGTRIAQSEHYAFVEDMTIFKGTARYDGTPVIAEGFVAIGVNNTTVDPAAVTFAQDTANA